MFKVTTSGLPACTQPCDGQTDGHVAIAKTISSILKPCKKLFVLLLTTPEWTKLQKVSLISSQLFEL